MSRDTSFAGVRENNDALIWVNAPFEAHERMSNNVKSRKENPVKAAENNSLDLNNRPLPFFEVWAI